MPYTVYARLKRNGRVKCVKNIITVIDKTSMREGKEKEKKGRNETRLVLDSTSSRSSRSQTMKNLWFWYKESSTSCLPFSSLHLFLPSLRLNSWNICSRFLPIIINLNNIHFSYRGRSCSSARRRPPEIILINLLRCTFFNSTVILFLLRFFATVVKSVSPLYHEKAMNSRCISMYIVTTFSLIREKGRACKKQTSPILSFSLSFFFFIVKIEIEKIAWWSRGGLWQCCGSSCNGSLEAKATLRHVENI